MDRWYRVFAAGDQEPEPVAILQHLQGLDAALTGKFGGDDAGWFYADLLIEQRIPLRINRYQCDESGIRAELNSWAAWVESLDADPALMERFVQTRQVFTFRATDETSTRLCMSLAQLLASLTAGLYQVDEQGLFSADGTLLLAE